MVGKAGLIMVIGFSVILGFMSLNMTKTARNSTGVMATYVDATLSHNLAVAGANIGLARFYADTSWFGDTTQVLTGPQFYGSVRYYMTNLGGAKARLRSVSAYKSPASPVAQTLRDTVDVFFDMNKHQTFSIFAWMTHNENGVNWTTADTVWGRVHSNSTITVSGKPVFMEKLTTSKNFNKRPGRSPNYAIFKNGYETGVPSIDFPNDLSEINAAASSIIPPSGKKYATDIWVTLLPGTGSNSDGKAIVRDASFTTGAINDTIQLSNPLFNGVLASTGNVHLKGVLDGALTIASLSNDIIVEDDLRYENNPRITASDDLLGLVSDDDVRVADNTANRSDCVIQASIFTRRGSFTADNYDRGALSGELHVLGSIVQNTRGPVGTISGSTLNSGFSKRYRYDERLSDPNVRPPYFPGYFVKTYAITNWWESYRIPNINL